MQEAYCYKFLCKIICHNIAVLIMSIFEYGIKVDKLRLLKSDTGTSDSHNVSSETTLNQENSH